MKLKPNNHLRQCCLTKVYKPKAKLIRIACYQKHYEIDQAQTKLGRGYYVDRSAIALAKLNQKNYLQKIIRDPAIYEAIRQQLKELLQKH